MNREEALSKAYKKYVTDGTISDEGSVLINEIYDDFEQQLEMKDIALEAQVKIIQQLKKDRDYWKLSFNKQVEANRDD